ncbi:BspA family leucine-rich repeat surface protein [Winogradskyella sp.]|uniref:BspA family leucine-rich repeat surface protein n=1 Tax=Winogradskyella sp. TaxID=1883156 RepID=UPI0026380698|nr:BspA family leucine-rich repeat surface protein [Winogradskyella sp.]
MRIKTPFVSLIFTVLFIINVNAQCDGNSDIIQDVGDNSLSTSQGSNFAVGNTFRATCDGPIEEISFYSFRVGDSNIGALGITLELYRNPLSASNRTLLGSVGVDISRHQGGLVEQKIELSSPIDLVEGVTYGWRLLNTNNEVIALAYGRNTALPGQMFRGNNFSSFNPITGGRFKFQIHYEDNIPPIANCRNITRVLSPDGTVSILSSEVNDGSTDADSGLDGTTIQNPIIFDCNDIGNNQVTFLVRDNAGNTASCEGTVTIIDNSAPVITNCPGVINVNTDPGTTATVTFDDLMFNDCALTMPAPTGFTFLTERNDNKYYVSNEPFTATEARTNAESLGGFVATILDETHNNDIRTSANDAGFTQSLYIGYSDANTEGVFTWHGTSSTYENWFPGEPNNLGGNEDYAILLPSSGFLARWGDVVETNTFRYVLELPNTAATVTQIDGLPSGSSEFPIGTTNNTFEVSDAYGNTSSCSFDIIVTENPFETEVKLENGKLTILDIENPSDDDIKLSLDGTYLTITDLNAPRLNVVSASATNSNLTNIPDSPNTNPSFISIPATLSGWDVNSSPEDMFVEVELDHNSLGQLIIELEAPTGETITLMDRPRSFDGIVPGDNSDFEQGFPITFIDNASVSAADMGEGIFSGQAVCRDDGICEYRPGTGAGSETLAEFKQRILNNGNDLNGVWNLRVADISASADGEVLNWTLDFTSDITLNVSTVTVALNEITNGIDYIAGEGDDKITFETDLTLSGSNNGLYISGLGAGTSWNQSNGALNLEGGLNIENCSIDSTVINLFELDASSLSIRDVYGIYSAPIPEPITILGETNLQASFEINLNSSLLTFNDVVNLEADYIRFEAGSDLTLGTVNFMANDTASINRINADGALELAGNISLGSNTELRLQTGQSITQTSGIITANRLVLVRTGFDEITASLLSDNNINALSTIQEASSWNTINLKNVSDLEFRSMRVENFSVEAPKFLLSENTDINVLTTGVFNGEIEVTATNTTSPAIVRNNSGVITFTAPSQGLLDFSGSVQFDAVGAVLTPTIIFDGPTIFNTPGISHLFDNLEVINGTFTLETDINFGGTALFKNAQTTLLGTGTISGGNVVMADGATINPGIVEDTSVGTLNVSDLSFSNDGVFAPYINTDTSFDVLNIIGSVDLTNANFVPTGDLTEDSGVSEIVIIDNDGTDDPVTGNFTNLEEGSFIDFGGTFFAISYVGGDGNDVSLIKAETAITLADDGQLTVTDINGGRSDDDIVLSSDGVNLVISNLVVPVLINGDDIIPTDLSTITIPLVEISNGVHFISEEGDNSVTIANDIALSGPNNGLKFDNLNAFDQIGAMDIGGHLEISGDGNLTLNLNSITAGRLSVNNVANIFNFVDPLIISGRTNLVANDQIAIINGSPNNTFNGQVTIEAGNFSFSASGDTTFRAVRSVSTDATTNLISIESGSLFLTRDVNIAGAGSRLTLYSDASIEITGDGSGITTDVLIIDGSSNGSTIARLSSPDNDINILQTASGKTLNSLEFQDADDIELGSIDANGLSIEAQTMVWSDITAITTGGDATFSGLIDITAADVSNPATLTHSSGDLTFQLQIGQSFDLSGAVQLTALEGTTTVIDASTITINVPSITQTIGNLLINNSFVKVESDINLLGLASFIGGAALTGNGTIAGGTLEFGNGALSPGGLGNDAVGVLTVGNLTALSTTTFRPYIQNSTDYDILNVQGTVDLNNFDLLLALDAFVFPDDGEGIILIDNDENDPVVGNFLNLPEGTGINLPNIAAVITYQGGDGNDVALLRDNVAPEALCADVSFAIGLDGIEIEAFEIDGGSTDNVGIASLLINGEPSINFSYDDLGANEVTLTVTDINGNTTDCLATIDLTSNVTFPILISEYNPDIIDNSSTIDIEVYGGANETFQGVFVIIEGNSNSSEMGLVKQVVELSGTFDANGLFTSSLPLLLPPSHTAILATSFSGEVGVTDIDPDNDGVIVTDDLSSLGTILDAISITDEVSDEPFAYAESIGGTNLSTLSERVRSVFREGSNGDVFAIDFGGIIYDKTGIEFESSFFDTAPTLDGTFGQINPVISLDVNQVAFRTTWQTDNPGISENNQVTIFTNPNETYNFIIDWGDGQLESNVTGTITHTYDNIGTYQISIAGTFPQFVSNGSELNDVFVGDALKLISIDQWGDLAWNSFENAFYECQNMDMLATDNPDLSSVTSLENMFYDCESLQGNSNINNWDVSTITTMAGMFREAQSFNQPLGNWNVSNVSDMSALFYNASDFNQDLNTWIVSNVSTMEAMFLGALEFNGNISSWNVSNVLNMEDMFLVARAFNQDISAWNVSSVNNMQEMFNGAEDFNQPLNSWNVSNVTIMTGMFTNAKDFNQPLDTWNVSNVTTMDGMFLFAESFNQPINNWDVRNVTAMTSMFEGALNFNQSLSDWDVSSVTSAGLMLVGSAFSRENYDNLLLGWSQLNLQPNVQFDVDASFCLGALAKQEIIDNYGWTFTDGGEACSEVFVTVWQTNETGTSANNQITIPTAASLGTSYNYVVDWGDGTTDFGLTGDMTHTYVSEGTYTVRISGDFPHIIFDEGGDRLKLREISQWGNISWMSMESAFFGCENLIISATDLPDLSNVTTMENMLRGAGNAIDINLWADITNWDVSNVENMSRLFRQSNFNQNIASWIVDNVIDMRRMFQNNTQFNQNISSWNTGNVTDMSRMFSGASSFNQDIGIWDVSKVQSMREMFLEATNFDQNLSAWDISSIQNQTMINMFRNAGISNENYDKTLIGWGTLEIGEAGIPIDVTLNANNAQYCESEYKRQELISNFGWTIDDDGKTADCNNYFITQWVTDADNQSITIPTSGNVYSYLVDWGDGTVEAGFTDDATHTYTTAGTYDVSITGEFPRIAFNLSSSSNSSKITLLSQWGTNQWRSMEAAFDGCENLEVIAPDVPDLSNVTDISEMFRNCQSFTGQLTDLSSWDVTNVEDMTLVFASDGSISVFNGNISNWNVDNVTTMQGMFFGATVFNQPLNSWNVANVTNMEAMFQGALAFNRPLDGWNVSNVSEMRLMFNFATDFNQNLGNWDISSLTDAFKMLDETNMSTANYDSTLIGWATLDTAAGETVIPSDVTFGADNIQFCAALEAKNLLESPNSGGFNWTITDAGITADCIIDTSDYFITSWVVSDNESITIPTNSDYDYNYIIDWGDGTVETSLNGDATHTYTTAGTYNVSITGEFPAIYFNSSNDNNRSKIQHVVQWGSNPWLSMNGAFLDCTNIEVTASDAPDLSNVSDMGGMFRGCQSFTGQLTDLSTWDVSSVEDMSRTFNSFPSVFNGNISNWNVSNVTTIEGLFSGAAVFNQPLENWNVSSVVNMRLAFSNTSVFNQPLNDWNVSSVTDMNVMFLLASAFDQPLNDWNVSNVTNMSNMFALATVFNQDLGSWDISSLDNASSMFSGTNLSTENYDDTLIGWAALDTDAGETEIPSNILFGARDSQYCLGEAARTILENVYNWQITDDGRDANCANDSRAFITEWQVNDGQSITIPTNPNFSTYNYTVLWGDGNADTVVTGDISHTYDNGGDYTVTIFGEFPAIYFDDFSGSENGLSIQNVLQWGSIQWQSMDRAFLGCRNLDVTAQDTPDLSQTTSMIAAFALCSSLIGNSSFDAWDVSTVETMNGTFSGCSQFNQPINNWNVGNVTNMVDMFGEAAAFNQPLDNWNVSNVTTMSAMFRLASSFNQPLESWNVSNVRRMSAMFSDAVAFNQPLNGWNVSNLNGIASIFRRATSFNQPLNNWDVSSVVEMNSAFLGCTAFDQPLDDWNVSNVWIMTDMFKDATSFNQPLNSWNVSSVREMNGAFSGCTVFNQSLDNWNVSNVFDMANMFDGAVAFDQDLGNWDISSLFRADNMLNNTNLSTENYDNLLIGWATLDNGETQIPSDITLGALGLTYCAGENARNTLTDPSGFNWTITDGGLDPSCPSDILLSPKVYLQGASLSPNVGEEGLMRDDLRLNGLIPLTSPYSDGLIADSSVFTVVGTDAIVDWVWVELRDGNDSSIVIASQSALLQRDGDIVDSDGVSSLSFAQPEGSYHVAVNHRNHIGIITNTAQALSSTTTIVDLSANPTAVEGGTNSVILLSNGNYGMYTGDFDGNAQIQNTDASAVVQLIGGSGYDEADMDINTQIQNADVNALINPNIGRGQQFSRNITALSTEITLAFANAEITNDGTDDFYEADILISSTSDFYVGSGQVYFDYSTAAFGENVSTNGNIEYSQPTGSILGYEFPGVSFATPAYRDFVQNDNTTSRVSLSFQQNVGLAGLETVPELQVTSTPKVLFHIKIRYTDVSEDAGICFFSDGVFQDQFFTACGGTGIADCTNSPGTQITDDIYDCSEAGVGTLGIAQVGDGGILLHPNPARTSFGVQGLRTSHTISVHDINGRLILQEERADNSPIDMGRCDDGVYLVRIENGDRSITRRLIKKSN